MNDENKQFEALISRSCMCQIRLIYTLYLKAISFEEADLIFRHKVPVILQHLLN